MPHNKHSIIIRGLLALYRVSGKDEYMRKAIKLGTRFKRCLTLKDGHYEWHYWDPAGAWDVHPAEQNKWKHWIGVEHKGGYYASTLSQAVALYQHGVVFDRADIARFLKTQLEKCWNGDLQNPKWARVDGTTSKKYMRGAYMCAALAPFNKKIETFCYGGVSQDTRLKNPGDWWDGGVVARSWLAGKLLILPKARGGRPLYAKYGKQFLAKESNRKFYEALRFDVRGTGYAAPLTPAAMKNMPKEPASK